MATLFFDLDGTLIDSAVGITRCVAHALQRMDVPVPSDAALRRWIGPSLRTSFGPLFDGDAGRTEQAVLHYRERFETVGWTEHEVFAGIGEAVAAFAAAGHRLLVVTAKNEPHARRIVGHLPFGHHFHDIVGATESGSISDKPELIAEALRRLGVGAEGVVMIGDRHMDIDGARHHGMASIGVLWGFGGEAELRGAGATVLAATPAQLAGALQSIAETAGA